MKGKRTARQELETVLDADHAQAVLEHRKAKRAPLTAYAASLLAKQFAKCDDPNAAADHMILQGWQGFRAEWMQPSGPNVVLHPRYETQREAQARGYKEDLERLKTG